MIEKLFAIGINNKSQSFHWSEMLEIYFVLQGEVDLIANNQTTRINPGQMQVVNVEEIHGLENATEDLLYIQLSLRLEAFDQYIPEISMVYFKYDAADEDSFSEEIKNYIAQMVRILAQYKTNEFVKSHTEQTLIYYCVEILSNLKTRFNYRGYDLTDLTEKEIEKIDQVRKITDYMFDNYSRKITLQEVADYIYIGTSALKKLLKDYGGTSFEKHLSGIRAEMSLKYLLDSNMSITNIAYECGFSAPRYYYYAFERKYQCSPAEYRKRNRKNFTKEKKKTVSVITYNTDCSVKKLFGLLEPYSDFNLDIEKNQNDIKIDLSQERVHKSSLNSKKKVLICEEYDAYRLHFTEELMLCKEKLGIHEIWIGSGNRILRSNVKNNVETLGMKMREDQQLSISQDEQYIDLLSLFGRHGEKKPQYYIHELHRTINQPFTWLDNNCLLYETGKTVCIAAFNNTDKKENLLYKFDISGLDLTNDYVCIKTSMPQLSKEMLALVNNGIKKVDNDLVKEIFKPVKEYNVYNSGAPFIIDVEILPASFVHLEIIKI